MRSLRIGTLVLLSTVGLTLSPAGASAAAKAPCASQKKALQRATGERKQQQRKRYDACLKSAKEKRLADDIKRQLTDQRLVGRRGDGSYVNWLFCANGKYRLATDNGISTGTRWVVTQVKGSAKQWTAVIRETANLRAGGLSIGVARKAAQYYVGIARGFGDVESQGAVTRTTDTAGCAAL
jgi:hypothetical protein